MAEDFINIEFKMPEVTDILNDISSLIDNDIEEKVKHGKDKLDSLEGEIEESIEDIKPKVKAEIRTMGLQLQRQNSEIQSSLRQVNDHVATVQKEVLSSSAPRPSPLLVLAPSPPHPSSPLPLICSPSPPLPSSPRCRRCTGAPCGGCAGATTWGSAWPGAPAPSSPPTPPLSSFSPPPLQRRPPGAGPLHPGPVLRYVRPAAGGALRGRLL